MIFWRIFVTDCGFGMRIFLFAGVFGIVMSAILGKRDTTVLHENFKSEYYFQAFNLFGAIIIWCLLPVLNWSDLWHGSTIGTDSFILHVVSLNMWFSLCGSCIGSYCGSLALYKRLSIHTIIFSVFTVNYILILGWNSLYFDLRSILKSWCSNGNWNNRRISMRYIYFKNKIINE